MYRSFDWIVAIAIIIGAPIVYKVGLEGEPSNNKPTTNININVEENKPSSTPDHEKPTFIFKTKQTELSNDVADPKKPDRSRDEIINHKSFSLDQDQQRILSMAYAIGERVGYPRLVQAIAMQETLAGSYGDGVGDKMNPVGKRSYGIMQVKVTTTRFVLRHFPEIKENYFPGQHPHQIAEENIIALLLKDDNANIVIGAVNFYIMTLYTDSIEQALVAYNGGLRYSREVYQKPYSAHEYVRHIRRKKQGIIKHFNQTRNVEVKNKWYTTNLQK